jgi:hypothetical protein
VAPEVPDTEEEEEEKQTKPKRKSKRKSKDTPKKSDGTLADPDSTLRESSGQDELEDECDIPAGFFQMEEVSTFQTRGEDFRQ